MTAKTKKDLENEILIMTTIENERKLNKLLFAEKRVEVLLYGLIGLVMIAFVGALWSLIVGAGK